MELIQISNEIIKRIKLLDASRKIIKDLAEKKSSAPAEYDKQLGIAIIKLKNGEKMSLEGNEIESPPATILEKIARGICWTKKLDMDKADAFYKNAIKSLDSLQAEMNALQTLYRHQTEM